MNYEDEPYHKRLVRNLARLIITPVLLRCWGFFLLVFDKALKLSNTQTKVNPRTKGKAMADASKVLERHYHISFSVINLTDRTIRTSFTVGKFHGFISQDTILQMETLIKQEWYLTHMGDSNFIPPTPTDPNDPLADLSLSITGMTLLEVDEHGKLYDWVKQNYQGE